jgi:ribosomal protein L11 methyltransferase
MTNPPEHDGTYVEFSVGSESSLIEQLIGILSQLGFEGFWEDEGTLRCYMKRARWSKELQQEIEQTVRLMFRSHRSETPTMSVRFPEDRNWNEAWEKTIAPVQVTDRIIIRPSWHEVEPRTDRIILTIDPKMSFGTGYHESTRLSIRLLEEYVRPGMSVLDVGTGTGILAIAAVRLGAGSAVGIDTDAWSFENAMENVVRNQLEKEVRIIHGALGALETGTFDTIVANIQRDVIEQLLDAMVGRMNTSGILILSGLLESDVSPLTGKLRQRKLKVLRHIRENDWSALACQRG